MDFTDGLNLTEKMLIAMLAIIVIGGGTLLYLRYFDGGFNLVEYNQYPVPTVEGELDEDDQFIPKDTFYTDETLTLGIDICKRTDARPQLHASFVNSAIFTLTPLEVSTLKGCRHFISHSIHIPKILPSDTYHVEGYLEYRINPLRSVRVPFKTQKFQVINRNIIGDI